MKAEDFWLKRLDKFSDKRFAFSVFYESESHILDYVYSIH